jgi:hypothetical protein
MTVSVIHRHPADDLPLKSPGLTPGQSPQDFVVDKVALGQFLQGLQYIRISMVPLMF